MQGPGRQGAALREGQEAARRGSPYGLGSRGATRLLGEKRARLLEPGACWARSLSPRRARHVWDDGRGPLDAPRGGCWLLLIDSWARGARSARDCHASRALREGRVRRARAGGTGLSGGSVLTWSGGSLSRRASTEIVETPGYPESPRARRRCCFGGQPALGSSGRREEPRVFRGDPWSQVHCPHRNLERPRRRPPRRRAHIRLVGRLGRRCRSGSLLPEHVHRPVRRARPRRGIRRLEDQLLDGFALSLAAEFAALLEVQRERPVAVVAHGGELVEADDGRSGGALLVGVRYLPAKCSSRGTPKWIGIRPPGPPGTE